MNKEHLKFWVTCPECRHKFGVESDTVFKYINRVLGQYETHLKRSGRKKKGQNQNQPRRESQ